MKSKCYLRMVKHILFFCICGQVIAQETYTLPLERRLDYSPFKWGEETNGIKGGLQLLVITNSSNVRSNDVWCQAWLSFQTNSTTKFVLDGQGTDSNSFVKMVKGATTIWTNGHSITFPHWSAHADAGKLLPVDRNYQINLMDSNEVEVARTARGEKLKHTFLENPVFERGVAVIALSNFYEDSSISLWSDTPSYFGNFHLNDFFEVTKPGKYHLQMQLRVFCCYARGKPYQRYEPLILPPIDVEFTLPKDGNQ